MPRLTRVHQKVFASNASNNGVFGSLQAGNPQTSNDVATLQSLAAFENGWDDAIEQGDKLPPLEEFQGIQYGISYQQAYMLQEGIAEWDASTPYYKGSLTKTISGTSFKLYCSLQDNNTGNIVTNTSYWKKVMDSDDLYALDSAVVKLTGNQTIAGTKTFSNTISGSINGNAGTVTNGVYTNTNQTISGNKTFTGSLNATTPTSATDHSTNVSTTQWFRNAITNLGVQHLTKYEDIGDLPYTAPIDGIMRVRIGATYNWALYINGIIVQQQNRNDSDSCTTTWATIPVKQGDVLTGSGSIYNKEMYYPY